MAKENNKTTKLTPHFTLEEMTHTNVELGYMDRQRQTQPDEQVIENLTRVCQWLEMLRQRWNEQYGEGNDPVIINSAFRCKELNRLVGGCTTSNHLTGCAADLRVMGKANLPLLRQETSFDRYRVYSRRIRNGFEGIKLPGTSPNRNRSPIHLESLVSSLLPLTAFTHFGLAMVT